MSDWCAKKIGSFAFLVLYNIFTVLWVVINTIGQFAFDKYPFGFYTFSVSVLAIELTSLLLISTNRQSERDRDRDNLEAEEVHMLMGINNQQLTEIGLLKIALEELRNISKKIDT